MGEGRIPILGRKRMEVIIPLEVPGALTAQQLVKLCQDGGLTLGLRIASWHTGELAIREPRPKGESRAHPG